MRSRRWNPATRHTVLGEPGNEAYLKAKAERKAAAVESGRKFGTEQPRPLYVIAKEIRADWKKPYFGAVPYLEALAWLATIDDQYEQETGESVVRYFLANAKTWRGGVAQHIKAELNAMLQRKGEVGA